jgi:enoyl-CoA hydratase
MTTTSSTRYEVLDRVATITVDDGKVNALSADVLGEISAQLAGAIGDASVTAIVLTGRERTFSAGFDIRTEPDGWRAMLLAGAQLAEQMLSSPTPIVASCTGHAIAMGAFILLSADHRIGVAGDYRIGLNEVAIGLTVPWFGLAIAEHRLTAPYFDRCTITGTLLDPIGACAAGFLDELVDDSSALANAAGAAASRLQALNQIAHRATKARTRRRVLEQVRAGIARIAEQPREEW